MASGPVVATRFPIVGKVWITTTYELTARVLKDSETFTLRKEGGGLAGLRWWMPAFVSALANNMLTMDEPDHTRLRGIVDEAFRRRAVLDMEPRIRGIADDLAGQLFSDGSPADLVKRYARTLPLSVICELLGLPPHSVRVIAPDVGGGFGNKLIVYPEDVLIPLLASYSPSLVLACDLSERMLARLHQKHPYMRVIQADISPLRRFISISGRCLPAPNRANSPSSNSPAAAPACRN